VDEDRSASFLELFFDLVFVFETLRHREQLRTVR
jgi:low temperature requirement protein LtrA